MSTDDIPGWAMEAAETIVSFPSPKPTAGDIEIAVERAAKVIARYAPQPSAEVAPDFVDHSNWRVALTACQQERDRLREAGNRLAEALEILKGNFEKGGCSRNADYRILVEIIAHWRATTEGNK